MKRAISTVVHTVGTRVRLFVFFVDSSGVLNFSYTTDVDKNRPVFQPYTKVTLGVPLLGQPAVCLDAANNIHVFCRTAASGATDNVIYHGYIPAAADTPAFNSWNAISELLCWADPAAALNPATGLVEVWIKVFGGVLYVMAQGRTANGKPDPAGFNGIWQPVPGAVDPNSGLDVVVGWGLPVVLGADGKYAFTQQEMVVSRPIQQNAVSFLQVVTGAWGYVGDVSTTPSVLGTPATVVDPTNDCPIVMFTDGNAVYCTEEATSPTNGLLAWTPWQACRLYKPQFIKPNGDVAAATAARSVGSGALYYLATAVCVQDTSPTTYITNDGFLYGYAVISAINLTGEPIEMQTGVFTRPHTGSYERLPFGSAPTLVAPGTKGRLFAFALDNAGNNALCFVADVNGARLGRGTTIGDYTKNRKGDAFDAVPLKDDLNSAEAEAANASIGQTWSAAKTVSKVVLTAPHDNGYFVKGGASATILVQGSNDGTAWTTLATVTDPNSAVCGAVVLIDSEQGLDRSKAYTSHRVQVQGGVGTRYWAAVDFFE